MIVARQTLISDGDGRWQAADCAAPQSVYLSPVHGQTKLGYFWTTLSPGGDVVYHWRPAAGQAASRK
jgi:hypothetical protein